MTTTEIHEQTNGKRKHSSVPPPATGVLSELRAARERALQLRHALREELSALDAELGPDEPPHPVAAKPKAASKSRGPRGDSLPSRILAALSAAGEPVSSSSVAETLGVKPTAVSVALGGLRKSGKVQSAGSRRDMTWSLI